MLILTEEKPWAAQTRPGITLLCHPFIQDSFDRQELFISYYHTTPYYASQYLPNMDWLYIL